MTTSWEQMSRHDQLAATHYDYYKDVHGIRPRWMNYDAMSEQDIESELSALAEQANVVFAEEELAEEQAIKDFEARVDSLMHTGTTRAHAVQRLLDSVDYNGDPDYACYKFGLPYGYFKKDVS